MTPALRLLLLMSGAGGGGAAAAPEPPLTNLAAWYRKGTGITHVANAVSQWDDQSGNARHQLQAAVNSKPTLQGDGTVLFESPGGGLDDYMMASFALVQPCTFYLRAKLLTWSSNRRLMGGAVNAGGEIHCSGTTPTIALYSGNFGVAPNSNLVIGQYSTVCAVFAGASSVLQVDATTATTGNAGATNPGGITLAAGGPAGGNTSHIQIAACLVYSAAHDATERAAVRTYLSSIGV